MLGGGGTPTSTRSWAPGKLCVADTSFVHRTRNNNALESRYVLHFSVWHPELSSDEARGITAVHDALRAYEEERLTVGRGLLSNPSPTHYVHTH